MEAARHQMLELRVAVLRRGMRHHRQHHPPFAGEMLDHLLDHPRIDTDGVGPTRIGEHYQFWRDLLEMMENYMSRSPRTFLIDLRARVSACDRVRVRVDATLRPGADLGAGADVGERSASSRWTGAAAY